MKSIYAVAAAALFLLIVGGAAFSIGDWKPGYEFKASTLLTTALLLIAFFALGYGAGLSEKRR